MEITDHIVKKQIKTDLTNRISLITEEPFETYYMFIYEYSNKRGKVKLLSLEESEVKNLIRNLSEVLEAKKKIKNRFFNIF